MDSKLYKGSVEPMILKLLSEHKEMYGYQLTQEIREKTNGEIEIKEGSLYPLLHRMEAAEIIQSDSRKVGNRIRKYYRITELGTRQTHVLLKEMQNYLLLMAKIFRPDITNDRPSSKI